MYPSGLFFVPYFFHKTLSGTAIMANHKQSGRFVWYDLLTTDTEAAIAFYGNIIGWGTEAFEGGPKPYTMLTNKGMPIGGLMEIEPEMGEVPPSWLPYISTPDVDETVEKIKELGGDIHAEPQDVPNAGRFAVATDPQGCVFAVFESTTGEPDMEAEPGVGEFSWHELATSDYQAAFDFYQALFGWEITSEMDMGDAGIYRMYGQNDLVYGGMFTKIDSMPGPPPPWWALYVTVEDIDQGVEDVEKHGGRVLMGPMEVPGGDRIAHCMDPQGAGFALYCKE